MKRDPKGTYHGPRSGPPGDDTVYLMPRDFAAWEKAWDAHLGTAPLEPLDVTHRGGTVEVDNSPEAVAARAEASRRHAEAVAYVSSYSGRWGLPLDIRNGPKWGTKYLKLSDRQVDALLAGKKRDEERAAEAQANRHPRYDEALAALAEARPGEFINSLRDQVARGRTLSDKQVEALLRTARPAGAPAEVEDGWYVVGDQPWKVQWNRERTGRYAKRLVVPEPGAKGVWEFVPGGLATVARDGSPMTIEQAVQYGSLYGVCAVCGRTLTNETSIEAGIGPICAGRLA